MASTSGGRPIRTQEQKKTFSKPDYFLFFVLFLKQNIMRVHTSRFPSLFLVQQHDISLLMSLKTTRFENKFHFTYKNSLAQKVRIPLKKHQEIPHNQCGLQPLQP